MLLFFRQTKIPDNNSAALVYSNNGMIWYDSAFAPASLNKVNANYKTKHAKLMLDADKFLPDYNPEIL